MQRKEFIELLGLPAFAVSATDVKLIESNESVATDCATSTDMLGPFLRKGAFY